MKDRVIPDGWKQGKGSKHHVLGLTQAFEVFYRVNFASFSGQGSRLQPTTENAGNAGNAGDADDAGNAGNIGNTGNAEILDINIVV